jgi:hypothetical protein
MNVCTLVFEDQQFSTILNTEMLAKYTTDFYTIRMYIEHGIKKFERGELLNRFVHRKTKVAVRKCKRVLLEDFEPVWIKSPDAKYWVHS